MDSSAEKLATFPTSDGYALTYRVWPTSRERRATLVLLNGVMSHSAWFRPLAAPLVEAGIHLVGADRRGSGTHQIARGDAPNAQQLVRDVKDIIAREHDQKSSLFLAGWCWGGVLAVNVAAEFSLSGLLLLAPGMWPTQEIKRRMADEVKKKAGIAEDDPSLTSPIVEEMFTTGPSLDSFVRRDADRLLTFTPRFHAINTKMTINAIGRLRMLKMPMLLVLAKRDRATDNEDTMRGFQRVPREAVEIVHIDAMHGLQFDAPEALARAMTQWIERRIRSGEQR